MGSDLPTTDPVSFPTSSGHFEGGVIFSVAFTLAIIIAAAPPGIQNVTAH